MNITGKYSANELTEADVDAYTEGALYDAGTHPTNKYNANGEKGKPSGMIGLDASRAWTGRTEVIGKDNAHNNLMPYISVYIFRRVS